MRLARWVCVMWTQQICSAHWGTFLKRVFCSRSSLFQISNLFVPLDVVRYAHRRSLWRCLDWKSARNRREWHGSNDNTSRHGNQLCREVSWSEFSQYPSKFEAVERWDQYYVSFGSSQCDAHRRSIRKRQWDLPCTRNLQWWWSIWSSQCPTKLSLLGRAMCQVGQTGTLSIFRLSSLFFMNLHNSNFVLLLRLDARID